MSHKRQWSQGICEDGAAILCDGQPITIEEILQGMRDRDTYRDLCGELLEQLKYLIDSSFGNLTREDAASAQLMITRADRIIIGNAHADKPVVMCNYCKHIGDVPAAHEFETSTGARTFACEQHANLAMTCMKPVGRVNTNNEITKAEKILGAS